MRTTPWRLRLLADIDAGYVRDDSACGRHITLMDPVGGPIKVTNRVLALIHVGWVTKDAGGYVLTDAGRAVRDRARAAVGATTERSTR